MNVPLPAGNERQLAAASQKGHGAASCSCEGGRRQTSCLLEQDGATSCSLKEDGTLKGPLEGGRSSKLLLKAGTSRTEAASCLLGRSRFGQGSRLWPV